MKSESFLNFLIFFFQKRHACTTYAGRYYVSEHRRRDRLLRLKLPHEWLHGEPSVMKIPISKNLAPPLKIYADQYQVMLTTIDSVLVWNRRQKDFKGSEKMR